MMRLTTREVLNREASCPSSNLGQCMREALAAHPEDHRWQNLAEGLCGGK